MSRQKTRKPAPPKATRPFPNLKTWREAHALNQHEAAKVLGFTQTAYSRMERGLRIPVREEAKHVMATTGVPLEVLVGVA